MDADLRRLERLAATGDKQAELQFEARRDRLALPWSVDPARDPVRRLLARTVRMRQFRRRAIPYAVTFGAVTSVRHRVHCIWRSCLPPRKESLYDTEAFWLPRSDVVGTVPVRRFGRDATIAGTSRADLPPMPAVPLLPLAPRDRLLLCYERMPVSRGRHNDMTQGTTLRSPSGRVNHWLRRMRNRLQAVQRLRTPRQRVYAALRTRQVHEVTCDTCRRSPAWAGRAGHCVEAQMLAAAWRQANYDTHASSQQALPVFGMPVSLFPGPDPPPIICVRCQLDRNEWPRRICKMAT